MSKNKFVCTSTKNRTVNLDKFEFEITWNIHKDVFKTLGINSYRKSMTYKTDFHNSFWHIKIRTNFRYPNQYGLDLCLEKAERDIIFSFASTTRAGDQIIRYDNDVHSTTEGTFKTQFGWDNWLEKDDFEKYSNCGNGFITVALEITAFAEAKINTELHKPDTVNFPPIFVSPCNQYLKLIDTGLYSDVTLVVKDREFKLHKNILASQCPYFESMFRQNFKESIESKVEINDVDSTVFEKVLKFIYAGKLPIGWNENTAELLLVADRFGLEAVVVECEKHLVKMITSENCLSLYQLADSVSRAVLKAEVLKFIKNNYNSLKEIEAWKEFEVENLRLFASLMKDLFEKTL